MVTASPVHRFLHRSDLLLVIGAYKGDLHFPISGFCFSGGRDSFAEDFLCFGETRRILFHIFFELMIVDHRKEFQVQFETSALTIPSEWSDIEKDIRYLKLFQIEGDTDFVYVLEVHKRNVQRRVLNFISHETKRLPVPSEFGDTAH